MEPKVTISYQQIQQSLDNEVFTLFDYSYTLGNIIMLPLVVLLGWWAIRKLAHISTYRLRKSGASADTIHLFKRIFYILTSALLLFTTLDILNVPLTAFAFLSGAVAIGIGFGAQNIINNFISGWILMWERPIRIGDFLEVDSARGIVEAINTRSTRIRRTDGVHMLIPNSKLLENTVINWTLVDNVTRTSVKIGVAYGSPSQEVARIINLAINEEKEVLSTPKAGVIFDDFGDNALIFEGYFWINAKVEGDLRQARSRIRFRLDELFTQAGIVIAYPQRDLHLDGAITLVRQKQENK
jgi:small-conductance mechanosensitive channel